MEISFSGTGVRNLSGEKTANMASLTKLAKIIRKRNFATSTKCHLTKKFCWTRRMAWFGQWIAIFHDVIITQILDHSLIGNSLLFFRKPVFRLLSMIRVLLDNIRSENKYTKEYNQLEVNDFGIAKKGLHGLVQVSEQCSTLWGFTDVHGQWKSRKFISVDYRHKNPRSWTSVKPQSVQCSET